MGIPCLEPLCPFSLLDEGCDDYADGRVCKVRFDANGATGPGGRDPTQVKLLPGRHMLFPPLERVHYLQVRDPAVHVPFWVGDFLKLTFMLEIWSLVPLPFLKPA